jgi:hypothetical protein
MGAELNSAAHLNNCPEYICCLYVLMILLVHEENPNLVVDLWHQHFLLRAKNKITPEPSKG